MTLAQIRPGGAFARAGLRDGDRIDLRDLDLNARIALMGNAVATQTINLVTRRASHKFPARFTGSTWSEGDLAVKLSTIVIPLATGLWCLACALIIAIRRSWSLDGRVLSVVLISLGIGGADPSQDVVFPNQIGSVVLSCAEAVMAVIALSLLMVLSSRMGRRARGDASPNRASMHCSSYRSWDWLQAMSEQ
jgi:hypothetical protein